MNKTLAQLALSFLLALPASAAFDINQFHDGDQQRPAIASAPDGRFVVAWESDGQDGQLTEVYARRYGANASPLGAEFRVNLTTQSRQGYPAVAMASDGAFAVAWNGETEDGLSLMMRRFAPDGTPRGGEVRVDSGKHATQPHVDMAMDAAGNFVIVWQERRVLSNLGLGDRRLILAQRYFADGSANGDALIVTSNRLNVVRFPRVAMNAGGHFVVSWLLDDADSAIQARAFDANGTPQGMDFQVNDAEGVLVDRPHVAMDAAGDFMVVWDAFHPDFTSAGSYARRYRADVTPSAASFPLGAPLQRYSGVAVDAAGGFAAVAHSDGVYLQCLGADRALGTPRRVDDAAEDYTALLPRIVANSADRWLLTWQGFERDGAAREVRAARLPCTP